MPAVSVKTNPLAGYVGAKTADHQADGAARCYKNPKGTLQQLDEWNHGELAVFIIRRDHSGRTKLCSLIRGALNGFTHLEYRQVHRYHHAADQRAEYHHDDRFHQAG